MKNEKQKHMEERKKGLKKYKWDMENLRELAKKINKADEDAYESPTNIKVSKERREERQV